MKLVHINYTQERTMATVTRIVCSEQGELHYSATPDLAMDVCPICAAYTVAKSIDIPKEPNKKDLTGKS